MTDQEFIAEMVGLIYVVRVTQVSTGISFNSSAHNSLSDAKRTCKATIESDKYLEGTKVEVVNLCDGNKEKR